MADYKVINFNQEWFEEEIKNFLKENPRMGFDPKDYKEFIKFCIRREKHRYLEDRDVAEQFADSE